jgi:alkylglycerol monooxygenase
VANPIALAVPVFFVSIGVEIALAKRRGVSVYRFTDAVTDLSCGITSQIILLVWAATQLAIYGWVLEHAGLVRHWPTAWLPWVVAFVGVDLLYYWWHRLSHEVNVLWAAHVVHHQSEDYNLAVALRQAVLTSWTVLPFYLPLALLGVPTIVYATMVAFSTLYQFWIHTQLVGRLGGPLEKVLNLPHHHRVHHAINPQYLDKNYGAVLVVWDRLFGTYEDEVEAPVYGITKPLASFDPMWAQVHYWLEMARMSRAARRPADKLRAWLASPAWKPEGFVVETPSVTGRAKYDRAISRRMTAWVGGCYALVVASTFSIMMWHAAMPRDALVLGGAAVVIALAAIGGLFEHKRWAPLAQVVSFALGAAAIAVLVRR